MDIDVVWKVIGYAALYKCHGNHVDEIQAKDLTATIFRYTKPTKLFAQLSRGDKKIIETDPGCYLIKGLADIVLQIVVGSELQEDDFKALQVMKQNATVEEVKDFILEAAKNHEQGYRLNAEAVLRVGAMVNSEVFEKIGGEESMGDIIMDVFKDVFKRVEEKTEEETLEKGIKIFIEDKLDDNVPEVEIIKKLQKGYKLSAKKATEYYNRFAKEPAATK